MTTDNTANIADNAQGTSLSSTGVVPTGILMPGTNPYDPRYDGTVASVYATATASTVVGQHIITGCPLSELPTALPSVVGDQADGVLNPALLDDGGDDGTDGTQPKTNRSVGSMLRSGVRCIMPALPGRSASKSLRTSSPRTPPRERSSSLH